MFFFQLFRPLLVQRKVQQRDRLFLPSVFVDLLLCYLSNLFNFVKNFFYNFGSSWIVWKLHLNQIYAHICWTATRVFFVDSQTTAKFSISTSLATWRNLAGLSEYRLASSWSVWRIVRFLHRIHCHGLVWHFYSCFKACLLRVLNFLITIALRTTIFRSVCVGRQAASTTAITPAALNGVWAFAACCSCNAGQLADQWTHTSTGHGLHSPDQGVYCLFAIVPVQRTPWTNSSGQFSLQVSFDPRSPRCQDLGFVLVSYLRLSF